MMRQSSQPFDVVRAYDPAIDDHVGRMRAEYAVTRDIKKLRFRDGCKPVVFRCKRLSRAQRRRCQEAPTNEERYERAYAFGVLAIVDLPHDWDDPSKGTHTYTPHRAADDLMMSEDALSRVGDIDIHEIGTVIWHTSFLAGGLPVRVPLLATSRDACLAVLARLAEQTKDSLTPKGGPSSSTESSAAPKAPSRSRRPTTSE